MIAGLIVIEQKVTGRATRKRDVMMTGG